MWDCPKCSEPIEESFRECWNCGSTRYDATIAGNSIETQEEEAVSQASVQEPVVAVDSAWPKIDCLFSTTSTLETHQIAEYFGIVSGEGGVTKSGSLEDISNSIEMLFNNELNSPKPELSYHVLLKNAREIALENMAAQANKLGANGVVGVNINYQKLGDLLIMVLCTGTAVRIEKK